MALIAGIDEAGYGPLLGPLVVSAAAFKVEDATAPDLWKLLSPAVTRKHTRHHDSIVVGDSKRLYSRAIGLKHLESAVLAFFGALDRKLESREALLAAVSVTDVAEPYTCPWHVGQSLSLPREVHPMTLEYKASRLKAQLSACGVRFVGLKAVVTSVQEFNERIRRLNNKAWALFESVGLLLKWAVNCAAGERFIIYVDKQGGRDRYGRLISQLLPTATVTVLEESETTSRYSIKGKGLYGMVFFCMDSEEDYLPVALASMCSKYLRELDLCLFNKFWQERVPDLKPTAGYATDAKRFIAQIRPALKAEGIAIDGVVRIK